MNKLFLSILILVLWFSNAEAFKLFGIWNIGESSITQSKDLVITDADGNEQSRISSSTGEIITGNIPVQQITLSDNTLDPTEDVSYSIYVKNGLPYVKLLDNIFPIPITTDLYIDSTIQTQLGVSSTPLLSSVSGFNLGYELDFQAPIVPTPIQVVNARRYHDNIVTNGKLLMMGFNVSGDVEWDDLTSSMLNIFTEYTPNSPDSPQIINDGSNDYFRNRQSATGTTKTVNIYYELSRVSTFVPISYIDIILVASFTRIVGGSAGFSIANNTPANSGLGTQVIISASSTPSILFSEGLAYYIDFKSIISDASVKSPYRYTLKSGINSINFHTILNEVDTHLASETSTEGVLDDLLDWNKVVLSFNSSATANNAVAAFNLYSLYIYWE